MWRAAKAQLYLSEASQVKRLLGPERIHRNKANSGGESRKRGGLMVLFWFWLVLFSTDVIIQFLNVISCASL